MKVNGTIENIIFHNTENGYTVMNLETQDGEVIAVGVLPMLKVGEDVELDGEYVNNQTYGIQFSFKICKSLPPKTTGGIVKYLSSGLIKGVGEATARLIVSYFKEDTLNVLENEPAKLANIKGISVAKAMSIANQYVSVKNMQDTIMFLQEYDITLKMAMKIHNIYQDKTIEQLNQNPYKLVEDIEGIGFLTADKIAVKLGLPLNSSFRFRAGVLHVLKTSADTDGHTFLPLDEMYINLAKLINIDEDYSKILENVLFQLQIDNLIKKENLFDTECIMLIKYYNIEKNIAKKLLLMSDFNHRHDRDLDFDITEFERINNIEFHEQQKYAVKTAIDMGVSIITGGPGTGKTTIINCILAIFRKFNKKVYLMAPTGRAAKRMSETCDKEAKTIHRALELEFGNSEYFKYNEFNKLPADVVIVDEVSMVDVNLFNILLRALPKKCQLILVGDKDQLPSVGAGNVLSDILASGKIASVLLTEIYRQAKESLIVLNAHAINKGQMPKLDNSSKDFFFINCESQTLMLETILQLITQRLPKYMNIEPVKIQVLAPMKNGVCGVENLNKNIQERINKYEGANYELVTERVTFRINDKVMQIVNDYSVEWTRSLAEGGQEKGVGVFNGDIGTIESIDIFKKEITVLFDDGRQIVYTKGDTNSLVLAYAITIHKSQGSEFDVVVMPIISGMGKILTRNLLYTAITRAKKLVVLLGEPKNLARMVHNNYTRNRYSALLQYLNEESEKIRNLFGELD